jgi:hypothetical protein
MRQVASARHTVRRDPVAGWCGKAAGAVLKQIRRPGAKGRYGPSQRNRTSCGRATGPLRRKFEEGGSHGDGQTVTAEDWQRSAEVFADLADPSAMEQAWR